MIKAVLEVPGGVLTPAMRQALIEKLKDYPATESSGFLTKIEPGTNGCRIHMRLRTFGEMVAVVLKLGVDYIPVGLRIYRPRWFGLWKESVHLVDSR